MQTTNLEVPQGRLFCFSSGEYSDYSMVGYFLALRDITEESFKTVKAIVEQRILSGELKYWHEDETITDTDSYEFHSVLASHFLTEFIGQGYVMEIDVKEIHLKSYGRLTLDI